MPDHPIPRDTLATVMACDFGRLLTRWRQLGSARHPLPADLDALRDEIAVSTARRAVRAASVPEIRIDASLPIAARSEEIVEYIRRNPVVVLAGETGSGKSTQLPKLCLAAGRGTAGLIGCTQPRRIAARSVARRVADELGSEVGTLVGFQVRFTDRVADDSLIKFMTDGILLAETRSDPWLSRYDTIILDEAHERSLNIDFLLGYLKRLLAKRSDLKLIVTSATIDTARFARHFGDAPVIEVEGRTYPVEVRWVPGHSGMDEPASSGAVRPRNDADPISAAERIVAVIDRITAEDPRGDVLVFLPGEREIRDTHFAVSRRKYRETEVLALYARLSTAEQDRVFKPGPRRRIVLATNVAETSLTVPRIRYVVDTGSARVKRYSPRNQLERLHVEAISQAAAEQRKGRCGRVGPGVCFRLYDEDDFARRAPYTEPEILRSSLAGVILRMLALDLGDPEDFPFVEAPSARAIGDGYRRLNELGAIAGAPVRSPPNAEDRQAALGHRVSRSSVRASASVEREPEPVQSRMVQTPRLTDIGRTLSRLPVDAALGRMLIEGGRRGVLREMLVLTAFLSVQDPRERPADARQQADAAHALFADPRSDFIGVLRLWAAYAGAHEDLTQSQLREWCQARFLSFLRMREWRELHRQLLLQPGIESRQSVAGNRHASASAPPPADTRFPTPAQYEAIHRCLLSGWPTQVARKDERGRYRATRERGLAIFPGSSVAKAPPAWLLAGQILDLARVYGLLCARVEPAWIEQQAAHLVKKSWRDPHWSRKRGAVIAFEQVTLFGLTLVEQRSVQFGRQDPALAHAIFLSEALARCELDARADFVRSNARVLAEAHEVEAKRRRSGLVRSDQELSAFFAGKLPAHVHTTAALDAWYRSAAPTQQAALHWSPGDVLDASARIGAHEFPATLDVAGHALRLTYRFVPGDPADGVTLQVPLALVNAVPAARCEWLVPGLLAEKVAQLIRGLPKALRRNFVPAPDFARAFVEAEAVCDEGLADVLARYLQRVTGVAIAAADFEGVALPVHLAMNFRIVDDHGGDGPRESLAESRDLVAIQAQWTGAARVAFSRRADVELTRERVDSFDFEDIPASVVSSTGLTAFPALVDLGESVALRVFERHDEALAQHRGGVDRLLRRALADPLKQARRRLPLNPAIALKWTPLGSIEELRADVVEAALRERFAAHDLDLRTRTEFGRVRDALAREVFASAVERLALAEAIIVAYAELRPLLDPPLLGFARANYDDLREQLAGLLAPGFLRDVESARLVHFPRYLKAMRLRAERLRHDPVRDQARMLGVQIHWREYLRLRAETDRGNAGLEELRWLIEELRVSTFAQELRTSEPVSAKRLAKLVESLRDV